MRKNILIILLIVLIIPNNVYATSGALVSSSIKTCPDGKTYGYHGSPRHWHEAEYTPREKGSNYSAIGSPIYDDPCKIENVPIEPEINNSPQENTDTNTINIISEENNIEDIPDSIENEIIIEDKPDNIDLLENDEDKDIINTDNNNTIDNTSHQNINDKIIDKTSNENNDIFDTIIGIGFIGASIGLISKIKKKN